MTGLSRRSLITGLVSLVAAPAIVRVASIISSQEWSGRPQIIFTLFDKVVIIVVLSAIVGLLILSGMFFYSAIRGRRCY